MRGILADVSPFRNERDSRINAKTYGTRNMILSCDFGSKKCKDHFDDPMTLVTDRGFCSVYNGMQMNEVFHQNSYFDIINKYIEPKTSTVRKKTTVVTQIFYRLITVYFEIERHLF